MWPMIKNIKKLVEKLKKCIDNFKKISYTFTCAKH